MDHEKSTKDPLEAAIGNFGFWQLKISLLMSLLKFPIAWFTLSVVFLAPPTQFWCAPPTKLNQMSEEKWLNMSLPDNSFLKLEGLNRGYCNMISLESNRTIACTHGYSYNLSIFKSTIISEWDLVCGKERLMDLSQIILMLGVLLGNILFGILADKHGRKNIIMTCIVLQSIFGITASLAPFYWLFVLLRFFVAITNGGTMVTSFVMCIEVVGGRWRTIIPILYQIPFGFGYTIMGGLAYFIRDWRYLHFCISALSSLYIFYYWFIPESPRWLLAVGRREEAVIILKKVVNKNGIKQDKIQSDLDKLLKYDSSQTQPTSSKRLFCTKELRKRSFLLVFNWTLCGIMFYAFSQYLSQIGTNIFVAVSSGGMVALPGTIACIVFVMKYGRRWTIAVAHMVTASCFLAILTIPKGYFLYDWPRLALSGLGIVGMSVSMPALYLFTGELYPTVLRNAGIGISIMFSRIGSMLAPLIITLEEKEAALPLIILAVVAFTQVGFVLALPETKDSVLPERVEDLGPCKIDGRQKYDIVLDKIEFQIDEK